MADKVKVWSDAKRPFRGPFGMIIPGVNEVLHCHLNQLLKMDKIISLYKEPNKIVKTENKKNRSKRINQAIDKFNQQED